MLPFVSKLLLARQLNFEKGKLSIFGQRVIIFPVELILLITQKCTVDKKFEQDIYDTMKEAVYQFCKNLNKRRNVKPKEMAKILINLAEMNGYGKLQIIKLDYEKKVAIFHMRGLPSELLIGKLKQKGKKVVDKYWGGMLAGGASFIFGDKNIEAIETRCVVEGKESCEFLVGTKDFLKKYVKKR